MFSEMACISISLHMVGKAQAEWLYSRNVEHESFVWFDTALCDTTESSEQLQTVYIEEKKMDAATVTSLWIQTE